MLVPHSDVISWLLGGHQPVAVPCSRTRVKLGPLERTLMAWAFWDLYRQGKIYLQVPHAAGPARHRRPVRHSDPWDGDDSIGHAVGTVLVHRVEQAATPS